MSSLKIQKHFLFLLLIALFSLGSVGCSTQRTFTNPDLAVTTLMDSLRSGNEEELKSILGQGADDLLFSGDSVEDQSQLDKFLTAYDQKHELVPQQNGSMVLNVGADEWPLPIPIVQNPFNHTWTFDTEAGKEEILNRRIGRNELDTIQTCLAIVDAQNEYAETDPEHTGLPVYAQKFLSTPGKKDGLYWETKEGEPPSPLGELAADAASEGYNVKSGTPPEPRPYHGYYFRILKGQGSHAPGGARDYMVGDKMLGGFAVVAYPADYENSGVMTFIVNQDGIVYHQNLGRDTAKIAKAMKVYDPDEDWRR